MNDFTKGKWHRALSDNATPRIFAYDEFNDEAPVCNFPAEIMRSYNSLANANLIATAGNTANTLASQGIDAIKAIEMLPQILNDILSEYGTYNPEGNLEDLIETVKKLKGEQA